MDAIRLRSTVTNDVATELAAWRFNSGVNLTHRYVETLSEELEVVDQRFHGLVDTCARWRRDLRVLGAVVAGGHHLDALANDAHGLANFIEANRVAVEVVTVGSGNNVEFDLVVGQIRHGATKVPGYTGATQQGPRQRQRNGFFGGDGRDALEALTENRLAGQELVIFESASPNGVADDFDIILPTVGQIGGNAARTDVVEVQAKSRGLFKKGQDEFTLAKTVDHHRG